MYTFVNPGSSMTVNTLYFLNRKIKYCLRIPSSIFIEWRLKLTKLENIDIVGQLYLKRTPTIRN